MKSTVCGKKEKKKKKRRKKGVLRTKRRFIPQRIE